jgi:hypothetical protein
VRYTPNPDYHGSDSFTYDISDGNGGVATATVNVTVNATPVAADDTATTDEDVSVVIDVLANDTDAEGQPLTVTLETAPLNGDVAITVENTCTYTPHADWHGSDSFTYRIEDGQGAADTAAVSVTVTSVNDIPYAMDDMADMNEDSGSIMVDYLANDGDADGDTLTLDSTSGLAHGTLTESGGVFTYTPDPNWYGTEYITYSVVDGNGGTAEAQLQIEVYPVDDAPIAADDTVSVPQDGSVTIDVLSNDTHPDGAPLTLHPESDPSHGAVFYNTTNVRYEPHIGYSGPDSFVYRISDPDGDDHAATVHITVEP